LAIPLKNDEKGSRRYARGGGPIQAILGDNIHEQTWKDHLFMSSTADRPAGIRSQVDQLDPIHRGGVILIRINVVTCCRTGGNQLKVKEMAGIRQGIPRCVIRTESQTSASYADQSIYRWADRKA
jgi:hypothetical protein